MAAITALRRVIQEQTAKGFGKPLKNLVVTAASEGQTTCQFEVEEGHLNPRGGLHGGFIATVIDVTTTDVLQLAPRGVRGVSVELNVSFLRPAKLGDIITVDARCIKVGRSLAFLEAKLTNGDGKLIATGKHTKYVGGKT